MALNIAALVAGAFATAKGLVPDAFPTVTLRLGPTTVVNPVTDTETTTWETTAAGLRPVAYQDKNEREAQPVEAKMKSFAFDAGEIPAGAIIEQEAEITEGSTTWNVYRVEPDPTRNLVIFHARR